MCVVRNTSLKIFTNFLWIFNQVILNFYVLRVSLGSSINTRNTNIFSVPSLTWYWKNETPKDQGPTQKIALPHITTSPYWPHSTSLRWVLLRSSGSPLLKVTFYPVTAGIWTQEYHLLAHCTVVIWRAPGDKSSSLDLFSRMPSNSVYG